MSKIHIQQTNNGINESEISYGDLIITKDGNLSTVDNENNIIPLKGSGGSNSDISSYSETFDIGITVLVKTITHNLNSKRLVITVFDEYDNVVYPAISIIDKNNIMIQVITDEQYTLTVNIIAF